MKDESGAKRSINSYVQAPHKFEKSQTTNNTENKGLPMTSYHSNHKVYRCWLLCLSLLPIPYLPGKVWNYLNLFLHITFEVKEQWKYISILVALLFLFTPGVKCLSILTKSSWQLEVGMYINTTWLPLHKGSVVSKFDEKLGHIHVPRYTWPLWDDGCIFSTHMTVEQPKVWQIRLFLEPSTGNTWCNVLAVAAVPVCGAFSHGCSDVLWCLNFEQHLRWVVRSSQMT